jgi:hypothetical protein
MTVTIASDDERRRISLDLELPRDAERLVLVDAAGSEHHFGCGRWVAAGTFLHVATYSPEEGLQKYAAFWEVEEAIVKGGVAHQPDPELGPRVSPRMRIALAGLRRSCNLNNGFTGEPEKRWAVDTLRALWDEARESFDTQELFVWAATHGWAIKDALKLQEIADGVREGKKFQGYDRRPISGDPERWRRMIEHWDNDAAGREDPARS